MSDELQSIDWLDEATCPCVSARFIGRSRPEAFGEGETTSHVIDVRTSTVGLSA